MPDQSDVENALSQTAADALYPNGADADSALGAPVRIHRGLPLAATLNADLAAGRVTVSVTPVDGSLELTTRYLSSFVNDPPPPTLVASVAGTAASFAGTAGANQLAGLLADDATYVYRTVGTDTPELVAAALAALVRADRPALLVGATVTIPGVGRLVARIVADTRDTIELRRQRQLFRLTVWSPSAALRDAAGALLDATLAAILFLDVASQSPSDPFSPDASSSQPCRLIASGALTSDQSQSAALYRRDLIYAVEYPTTVTALRPAMLFGTLEQNGTPTLV